MTSRQRTSTHGVNADSKRGNRMPHEADELSYAWRLHRPVYNAPTNVDQTGAVQKGTMGASRFVCFLFVTFLCSALAHAAGFQLELKLGDGKITQSQRTRASSPKQAAHRITLASSVGARFSATWKVSRINKVEAQDTLVHFVVVKLDHPGQAVPPLEPARVPIECALTMDFSQNKTATGTQPFDVEAPGVYLVRIEAGGDTDNPGQEDFAEIELNVK